MTDYPMCPHCRAATIQVRMALDVRDPCPHCNSVLIESLRVCCLPDCRKTLPVTRELPVCRDCGIKIALAHLSDAAKYDVVLAERNRQAEARAEARRTGKGRDSVVYYVRLSDDRIKIGFTSRLRERMGALRVHPSDLLAVEPGGRDVERERHAQFAKDRISARFEDFRPSVELLQWIRSTRAEHDLPDFAKVPDTRVKVR